MFSEIKILQCIKNDVVVNLNDVMRIVHCALNIESAQPFAILTFALYVHMLLYKNEIKV